MGRAVAQERAKLLEEEQRRERAEEAAAQAKAAAETRESQMAADRRKYPVQEMRERVQELEAEVERLRSTAARAPPPLVLSEPSSPAMATQQLTQMQALQTLGEKLDALGAAWELPDSDVTAEAEAVELSAEEQAAPVAAAARLKAAVRAEQLKVARLAEVCALLRGEVVQSPVRDQNKMRAQLLDLEGQYLELQDAHAQLLAEAQALRESREAARLGLQDFETRYGLQLEAFEQVGMRLAESEAVRSATAQKGAEVQG